MKAIRALLWIALAAVSARLIWIGLERKDGLERLTRAARRGYAAPDTGRGLKITHFYARETEITDGDRGLLCYGVRDAERVWLEPPVEEVRPTLTRCFFVDPRRDTSYTLLAEDSAGNRVSETLRVRVEAAPPEIRMFASEKEIQKGDAATFCYGVEHARTVRLEPVGMQVAPSKACVRFYPSASMTFTLVATGEGGRTDRRQFRVAVK
jgi:hypothetical protein